MIRVDMSKNEEHALNKFSCRQSAKCLVRANIDSYTHW